MHSGIYADALMRSVALAVSRNQVGANRPITEVLASEGITQQEYNDLGSDPQFTRYVDAYTKELTESGFSFAAKSRLLAEDLLPMAYKMARDSDVPAPVRAKMIENLVEWGDLKPRKDTAQLAVGNGFSITINIPEPVKKASKESNIIDITPESVEEEENNPQESVECEETDLIAQNVHSSVYLGEEVHVKKQITALTAVDEDYLKPVDVVDQKDIEKKLDGLFDEADDYTYAGEDVLE